MESSEYNIWFALLYEVLYTLKDKFKNLRNNKIVKMILNYCRHDWVLWKVELTLKDVDKEAEQLKKYWEEQEPPKFLVVEHEPDGSKAQELLGGAIEIKSNFKRDPLN